jgi:phage terminase small subunit
LLPPLAPPPAAEPPASPPESGEPPAATLYSDPKAFLFAVMNDERTDEKLRVDAAKSLMPFMHQKLGEGGKKEAKDEAAKKVASRFAASAPPKLAAVGGKKL